MKTALIVGVSGMVGGNLSDLLVAERDWKVYGVARRPGQREGVISVAVDIQDAASVRQALKDIKPTHIFFTTWLRQATEAENIRVNAAMVRNVLDTASSANSVAHVSLVTGLKHYLGPFEAYAKGHLPATPLREEQARLDIENFYYAQEDEVFAAAARDGYSWSIHRPHTIIGYAVGNAMNMGSTLAVYATICKELSKPMQFPGSAAQWNGLTDITDARILARQLLWSTAAPAARNQAFNIVNGDNFRWKWMWPRIAGYFGVEAAPHTGEALPLEKQLADAAPVWRSIAEKYALAESDIHVLASAWHTDADLGRPIEVITDMSKSRKAGFKEFQASEDSFLDLFATLRAAGLIP